MTESSTHLTLTMAKSVAERLLDPATREAVFVSEMMDACMAVHLAKCAGEIEATTRDPFSKLMEQSFRGRLRVSPEGWQDVEAWLAITKAEKALPRTAMSATVN